MMTMMILYIYLNRRLGIALFLSSEIKIIIIINLWGKCISVAKKIATLFPKFRAIRLANRFEKMRIKQSTVESPRRIGEHLNSWVLFFLVLSPSRLSKPLMAAGFLWAFYLFKAPPHALNRTGSSDRATAISARDQYSNWSTKGLMAAI